ncbi:MAG: kinase-like domain-containing protein [Piptocephalis tieghemiana]|nr:MAG: kinase-like domain-containing protein [Piptocephalis tieghemiana]
MTHSSILRPTPGLIDFFLVGQDVHQFEDPCGTIYYSIYDEETGQQPAGPEEAAGPSRTLLDAQKQPQQQQQSLQQPPQQQLPQQHHYPPSNTPFSLPHISRLQVHGDTPMSTGSDGVLITDTDLQMSQPVLVEAPGNTQGEGGNDINDQAMWDELARSGWEDGAWGFLDSMEDDRLSRRLLTRASEGRDDAYLIGRHQECDIHITGGPSVAISNRHCVIYRQTEVLIEDGKTPVSKVYLTDLSSNGTYVNGEKVGRNQIREIHSGDVIRLSRKGKTDGRVDSASSMTMAFIFYRPVHELTPEGFHESFELKDQLGKGNFAVVYKAKNRVNGKVVAVKVVDKTKFTHRPRVMAALQREVGLLMTIDHPCAIRVKQVFQDPSKLYLVMELAEGGELFDRVVKRGRLTEPEARSVFLQLLGAIKYLHDRNITHRDLKPENIMMCDPQGWKIKVTDFGLAKLVGENRFLSTLCGTPNYVAPEVLHPVAKERAYGKAVDMWSLGVILYIMLCGFPPFSEELAPPSMKEQILGAYFDFPSPAWDSVSSAGIDLVEWCLTKEPHRRITVDQALDHHWTKEKRGSLSGEYSKQVIHRFKRQRTLLTDDSQEAGEKGMDRTRLLKRVRR